ncbi:MAG: InlB B-repeat-containing protein, partial [Oscillibacter sp.]|nr:InlB B-repeat-containing protein [Oscillibacter sp.]
MKLRKGTFLLLLTLCAALVMAPSAAAESYGLHVGGVEITSDNLTVSGGSGTATYDPDSHTLTLNNYSYSGTGYNGGGEGGGIDYRGGDLRIELVGSNSIVKSADSSPDRSHGIYFNGGTLTIGGEGSLDISFQETSSGIWKRNGIFCEPGTFVMESGTVTAAGGTADESAGIYTSSGITINGGTFTGIGNPTTNYESRGIYSGSITINAGTVTARATNGDDEAYAFHGGVTVNGGEVTASASSSGEAKAFSSSCNVAGELLEMKVGDSAESAVATTNPGDVSGKKYAYISTKPLPRYTATFDANGGEGAMDAISDLKGHQITLPANAFSAPTGKVFNGWLDGESAYQPGEAYTLTADMTFSAIWADAVTVTFDSNGGGAVDSQTIPINTNAVKPKAPARDGFIFRGWELDGTSYDFSAPVTQDITLSASWIEGLSVTADFEDGAFPDGWTQEGNGSWSVGTGDYNDETGAHGGSLNAKITHSDDGNETYLIMPAQDLSGKTAASLSFWYINRSWGGDIDAFGAYYRIDGGDWTELFATTEAHESWTEWSDALPDAALAANIQIGFKMTDNYGYGVGLDDVSLEIGGHSWSYAAEGAAITATCQNEACELGENKSLSLTLTESDGAVTLDGLDAFNAATGLAVSESDIQYYSGETLLSEAPSEAGSYTAKLTAQGVTASKAFQITDPVAYLDAAWNETTKTVDFTEKTCADYAVVASDSAAWGAGWYAVTEDVTIAERVTVAGEVYLILCDGATLTASKGITVDNDNKLTVYAQSGGTGALKATGTSDYDEAGIGAFNSYNGSSNCGTVAIHGGVIEAVSARGGAGIGGAGGNSGGGNITIYGGDITAVGNGMNTGIGSGWRPYGSTAVTIYGGEINATGGQRAAGIGGGTSASNINVEIYGGVINATGGSQNSAGIGYGDDSSGRHIIVAIHGGDVTASGVLAIGAHSTNETTALTIADSLSVKAGEDAASATDVTSSFAASHAQKYAHIFTAHTHDGDGIAFEPWNASDSLPTTAGNYALMKNVTLSSTWNVPGGVTNLCLNGYSVTMVNPTKGQGSVIKIDEGATLNLYDCDETTRYYYIGKAVRTYYGDTYHYLGELVETTDDSRYVNAARKGSFTGGYITGGNGSYTQSGRTVVQGGGVWVNGGVLNLYGGCIFGNYSSAASSQGNEGGGVEVFAGTFHMGGGYIIGNQGGNVGGGVDVNANGAFTMSGGEIRHNTASEGAWAFGGGVNGALTMTGGIISGNAALYSGLNGCGGGGINGTLIMSGGVIEGNSASNNGGGVSGSLTVSGDAQIINNWKAGSAGDATSADWAISDTNSNAYIANGQSVAVVGGLSESASVGVTMQTPGVFTSGLSGNGAASNFTSDDAAYSIKLNSGGEALLATPATLDTAPAAQSLTYNGAEQALVTAGAATGGAVQYKAGDSGAYSETVPTAKNAGTYTVYYKVVGDDTHTDTAEASVSVMIAPKETALEWADTALTYNGAAQKPTATVSNLASGDSCGVTVTGEQTDAGTYTATATALDNANYTLPTTATKAFTIGKATLTVTAAAQSKTYGEDDPELTFTASGFVGDDTEDLLTGALSRETGENAGTYAVTQGTLSAGDNYAISFTGANLTINKATLTVTAAAQSKTYGEDDPE